MRSDKSIPIHKPSYARIDPHVTCSYRSAICRRLFTSLSLARALFLIWTGQGQAESVERAVQLMREVYLAALPPWHIILARTI